MLKLIARMSKFFAILLIGFDPFCLLIILMVFNKIIFTSISKFSRYSKIVLSVYQLSQYFLGQFFCEIKREYKSQFKIQIGLYARRFSCSKYLEVLPIERRWRSFSFGESVLFTSCFDHKAKRDSSWQSCICNLRRDPPSLLKARLVVDTMMSG